MSPEEALSVAEEALIAHTDKPLTDIHRMILRESLAGKSYEQMEGYTSQHIKNEGKILWDLLSKAVGEKVSKPSFRGALEKRSQLTQTAPKAFNPSIYDAEIWVGRDDLIDRLLNQLHQRIRFVCLIGISGIGKTALAECLAVRFQNPDTSFHRVSFDIEGQSQDFTTGASAILAELGEKELDPQERNDPQRLSDRLLQKLQTRPHWIQLDALERLLDKESAEFVDSHWLSFFQRCLGSSNFPSRLVLTTQTAPAGFEEFVDRYPMLWHEKTLQGLSVSERLELFARNGIATNEINRATIDRIGQIYEGHPLVLQVIAREILARPFNGNVAQYWERYGNEFEQVARELQQSQRVNPALYSRELQNRVRQRVEKSLKRLPTDALDLLCRASVYRRPVPEIFWLAMIDNCSPTQQQEAYQTLGDRALVEQEGIHQGQFLIRQHNLIRDIAYDLLRQDSIIWETAERQAAELWLTAYDPPLCVTNLEKVQGYLEAFYHFYMVKDWEEATKILLTQPKATPNQTLHITLSVWSYYPQVIDLLESILGKLHPVFDCVFLNTLVAVFQHLGDYQKSIDYLQRCLDVTRRIKDRQTEGVILGNLGLILEKYFRDYDQAIHYQKMSLSAAREIQNRDGEATALGNISSLYIRFGNYKESIGYAKQSIKIAVMARNRVVESASLQHLGDAHLEFGDYKKALYNYRKSLAIMRAIGDQLGESSVLCNLGITLTRLERFEEAAKEFEASLKICKEIKNPIREAITLKSFAKFHQKTGSIDQARQYCDRALELAIELGIPLVKECEELKAQLENEP